MEKKNQAIEKKIISSRNKNKNRNKSLQTKAKERELAKKGKLEKVDIIEALDNDEIEIKAIVIDTPDKEDVVVVPEERIIVDDEDDDPNFISIDIDKFRFSESDVDGDGVPDRFCFVESDTAEEEIQEDELEEFLDYNKIESVELEEIEQLERDNSDVEAVSIDEEMIPPATEHIDINAKKHISFENRIVAWLVFIVVAFFIAGLLIFKALTYVETAATLYDERGSVEYEVCVNEATSTQYYANKCLDEGMEYLSSITENVPLTFKYEMNFNNAVSTKVNYYVASKVNIYREKNGKVLNTMEDVLVERTSHDVFGSDTSVAIDVVVPFKKYSDYVSSYSRQYGIEGYADLEVVFYIDNGNVIKRVSSVVMPLSTQTFSVLENEVINEKQNLNLVSGTWGSVNTSYAVVGVLFVLFGVFGIIRLSNLVFKVIGTSSMYQRKLNKILREYDRYIVISRGDYNLDNSKRLIKVTTFGELLDARNTLEKPIVYVRINNVKSEFYVEDSETVYRYTLKEADFEGK